MRHIKLVLEDKEFKRLEDLKTEYENKLDKKVSWEEFVLQHTK